jgi:thiamine-phosphate pyrophosphorylase|tara:strand:+ start:632 stop:1186 length:555 start_codon:yes stop_codon:yes gene_type:complete
MQKKLPNVYLFIDYFNPLDLNALNQNISIIYRNYKKKIDESTIISLKNYCKLNKRKLYLALNIKLAIKHKLDGVYIPSFVKTKNFNLHPKPKNFFIIGSAHNKSEIINKIDQGCSSIFLAPIFKVNKKKKFLGIHKFNYLTLNFKKKFIALGGINQKNVKRLKLLNCKGYAGISWIKKNRPKIN